MLAGRNDIAPLVRYAKNMAQFSDDGKTQHGAYGHRWLYYLGGHEPYEGFPMRETFSQLRIIAERLRVNQEDRRCVLQMWNPELDLGQEGKDFPCNVSATFQRDEKGRLDLTVFCRSNDIIWGQLGANLVHMSMLLEYMAHWIGCPVGTYTQVSVNWHAYMNKYMELEKLPRPSSFHYGFDPYNDDGVVSPLMTDIDTHEHLDEVIQVLLARADSGSFPYSTHPNYMLGSVWAATADAVLRAHHLWRTLQAPSRFTEAIKAVKDIPFEWSQYDWTLAMHEWLSRRYDAWLAKEKK